MALPRNIASAEFPGSNNYVGPFEDGESVYTILRLTGDITQIDIFKSTNPVDEVFIGQDPFNGPDVAIGILCVWAFQVGTDLHIVHQEATGGPRVGYSIFHMATDLWDTISDELVDSPTLGDIPDPSCSIAVRSDGDVIVLYAGQFDLVHGANRSRIDYARREGGTWTTGIAVDNGGADHWLGAVIVAADDGSDRMHFFFKNDDVDDAFQRTLLSDNSLESFPSAGDSAVGALSSVFGPGVSYDDGGVRKIRCPYADSNDRVSYAEFDSVDAPGAFTINPDISDNVVRNQGSSLIASLAVDGKDEHLLYADSTDFDLFHDKNDGVDEELLDGVTINNVSNNVYNRAGRKLAYVYEDGSVTKYNELHLGTSLPPIQPPMRRPLPHVRM